VFGRSYSIPVAENGYLYGFRGQFLSCVDAANGEVVWKSRPPGGKDLILVDGHLVINGKDGDLVIVKASSEGYKEVARLGLFEQSSYTPASFSDGRIFVRDLNEIAAVRITETGAPTDSVADQGLERELMGEFGKWVLEVEAADDKDVLIEAFLAEHETFPVIEDGSLVHFIYRGEVEDIALAGTFLSFSEQIPMDRIAGTEMHFRSLRLDPKTNWEYYFDVNLGTPTSDPRNPNSIGTFFGPGSELRMPGWSVPEFLSQIQDETAEIPKGRVDSFEFRSDARDNTRRIQVYLPAGYSGGSDRFPLLVMHYGGFALNAAGIDGVLDSLIAGHTAPFIAVLLPQGSLEEGGGEASGEYVQFLTDELIPFMDRNYRTVADPGSRATMGIFDGGTLSVYSALKAPGVFGKAAAQSSYLKLPVADEIYDLMEARNEDSLEFYVRWTPNDLVLTNGGIDCGADSKRLSEMLSESGYQVDGDEVDGSWGWGTWRAQYGPILEAMFPPLGSEDG
jgi:enterochelin esterase family protein